MARERLPADDELNRDPQLRQLLEYLTSTPLPLPPEHVVARARGLFRTRQARDAGPVQQAIEYVAQLIFDSRASPALAGFRGGGDEVHLLYGSDLGEIDLQIHPPQIPGQAPAGSRGEAGDLVRILGQVETEAQPLTARLQGRVRGDTRGEPGQEFEAQVDDGGLFALQAPRGRYDLTIALRGGPERAESTIRVPDLEL